MQPLLPSMSCSTSRMAGHRCDRFGYASWNLPLTNRPFRWLKRFCLPLPADKIICTPQNHVSWGADKLVTRLRESKRFVSHQTTFHVSQTDLWITGDPQIPRQACGTSPECLISASANPAPSSSRWSATRSRSAERPFGSRCLQAHAVKLRDDNCLFIVEKDERRGPIVRSAIDREAQDPARTAKRSR